MGSEFPRFPPFFLESEPAGRPAPVGSRLGAPALRIGSAAFRQSGRSTGRAPGPRSKRVRAVRHGDRDVGLPPIRASTDQLLRPPRLSIPAPIHPAPRT